MKLDNDIIELFDYTFNDYTKKNLYDFFEDPLNDVDDIIERQNILKGILANEILFKFSYSKIDFYKVREYTLNIENINNIKFKLFISKELKLKIQSELVRNVYFLDNLYMYLKNINTDIFPVHFQNKIKFLYNQLIQLNVNKFKNDFSQQSFSIKTLLDIYNRFVTFSDNAKIFWNYFSELEMYISLCKGISKNNFTFPIFSDSFIIEGLYHPLLNNPVKNDISVNTNLNILTGPNMSGKSTLLYSLGLCVYLSHLGLGIPAIKFTLPVFDYMVININNNNLKKGFSHFYNELYIFKESLLQAYNNLSCFCIFDELYSGTNTVDALEISEITFKGLGKFSNSYFFISTHLYEVFQNNKYKNCTLYNMKINYTESIPVFTYKLDEGL